MTRALRMLGWLLLLAGLVPLTATVWVSFSPDSFLTPPTGDWSIRWYRRFVDDPRWTAAAGRSLLVAATSAIVCVAFALPATLSKATRSWLDRALLLPAVLPPVALGVGLLPLFHRIGLWDTLTGVILVHTTLGLPIALLILRTHSGTQLAESELAARGLGARGGQVFRRVTVPLMRPAIFTAVVVQFVLSWNESLVTVFLTSSTSETLPVVMWSQLRGAASPLVAVSAVISAAFGVFAVAVLAGATADSTRRG